MERLNETHFDQMWEILIEAFPLEEYRPYEEQKALFQLDEYNVYGIVEEGTLQAFLTCYEFDHIRFGEHLATNVSLRGSGIGKKLMLEVMEMDDVPIIFEVEKPENEMAKRRIAFYERLGCHLYKDITYVQPPFRNGYEPLPLCLMSVKRIFTDIELKKITDHLYDYVYHWQP